MKIEAVILREVRMPLIHPFQTSFGKTTDRKVILVEVRSGSLQGWGECVAGEGPFFSYETVETAWSTLSDHVIPKVLHQVFESPSDLPARLQRIRGHHMAKASVEAGLWDLHALELDLPLWKLLGGTRERIACGVSIGIQKDTDSLLRKVEKELADGYQRIKIKIQPGWDVEMVRSVRQHYPEPPLMVDANAAYKLRDVEHLKKLDEYNLLMIEQPLRYDDLIDHAELQAGLQTAVCLDESIRHSRDAAHACQLKACRIINIKMGRVGGHTEAKNVHDVSMRCGMPVWCGGMLETGIGRAHNAALSTLENFTFPGDVSASRRYFERDTIRPPVEVTRDGHIELPDSPGLGYEPDLEWINQITVRQETFN